MPRPLPVALALLLAAPTLARCDGDPSASPTLRVDGVLAGPAGVAYFPATAVAGSATLTVEILNPGGAALDLTASPPVRLERDDVLAFALTQPPDRRLAPGASTAFTVTFSPRALGTATAQLVIPHSATGYPALTLALAGDGVYAGTPRLAVAVGDVGGPGAWQALATPTDGRRTTTLRLTNTGDAALSFASTAPLTLSGAGAASFTASAPTPLTVEPGAQATATLAFAPTACGRHEATLAIASNAADGPHFVALSGAGVVSPQRHEGVADTALLELPDLSLALSADGSRVAVANPAADTFDGEAAAWAFDGCALSPSLAVTGQQVGYGGSLFASAGALSGDGATFLVTARDHPTAWVFDLEHPGAAPSTLATADGGAGHGRAAALSQDGALALIGQPLASSGSGPHGAAFLWRRAPGGWTSVGEADLKLLAPDLSASGRLGQTVALSADGAVVAAAAIVRGADQAQRAAAFLYLREGETWGTERLPTNTRVRNPHQALLATSGVPIDQTVRVGVAADGQTVAFSIAEGGGAVALFVFEADGDGGYGVAASGVDAAVGQRRESVRLRLTGSPAWRFVFGADASFLLGGDAAGLHEWARPVGGWAAGVSGPTRRWELATFGDLALGDGDAFVAALGADGALQLLWR